MKMKKNYWFKNKPYLLLLLGLLTTGSFFVLPAYSQIDYSYGLNKRGFRLGIGGGAGLFVNYYPSQSWEPAFFGSIDYDFSPYLSIGTEFSNGNLKEVDTKNKFYYLSSTWAYINANFNIKMSYGLLNDFDAETKLAEVLKRTYVGLGIGLTNRTFTHPNGTYPTLIVHPIPNFAPQPYSNPVPANFVVYVIDAGTNIPIRGLFGNDKIEINPNYQFNWLADGRQFEGFAKSQTQTSKYGGVYSIVSLSVKYKF